jgi:hypothetical protein
LHQELNLAADVMEARLDEHALVAQPLFGAV